MTEEEVFLRGFMRKEDEEKDIAQRQSIRRGVRRRRRRHEIGRG